MFFAHLREVPFMFSFLISLSVLICLTIYRQPKFYWSIAPVRLFKEYKWCVLGMLLGGKILSAVSLISYAKMQSWNLREYILHLGFVYYGAIIGTVLSVVMRSRFKWSEILKVTDTLTRLLPIGQAIGRFACFFNGCCYGKDYDGPLAVLYRIHNEYKLVFPIWFVESFGCLILGIFMLKKCDLSLGTYTCIYGIFYGILRFCVEFLRGDSIRGYFAIFSTSQWISMAFIAFGILGLIMKKMKGLNEYEN